MTFNNSLVNFTWSKPNFGLFSYFLITFTDNGTLIRNRTEPNISVNLTYGRRYEVEIAAVFENLKGSSYYGNFTICKYKGSLLKLRFSVSDLCFFDFLFSLPNAIRCAASSFQPRDARCNNQSRCMPDAQHYTVVVKLFCVVRDVFAHTALMVRYFFFFEIET